MPIKVDESDIKLVIAGQEISYIESYDIKMGIFAQPGTFRITCGWSQSAGKLIKNVTPYTPFKLYVGGKPAFSGRIGEISAKEDSGTTITFTGKDNLGDLFRYKVDSDLSFTKTSYRELLQEVLKRIGISPVIITGDNGPIADKRMGTSVRRYMSVISPETDGIEIKESVSVINSSVKAKLGDSFYSFLKSYFDRASLFLWAGTDNEFILSRPNTKQEPAYSLVRNRDQESLANRVNCKLIEYKNNIEDRHAEIRVNCRTGSTKAGRTVFLGSAIDNEILSYGLRNFRSVRDKKTNNVKQAEDMAKRIRAEEQRKGSSLKYKVTGHRTKAFNGSIVTYTPDTIIRVKDDELNIFREYYIEDVEYTRSIGDGTKTLLTLINPDYMVFL